MYNSDGYIFIDMSEADFTKASQHITGVYDRIRSVIKANKLVVVINANNYAPMAATVKITGILMEIITDIYIFTVNSNDILIIKENSGSFTEVTIVPSLLDGVKIADYSVGDQEGSLYAPKQQSEINDNQTSLNTTFSSYKIIELLSGITIDDLSDIGDVDITNISDGDILSYDALSNNWINIPKPSGAEVDIITPTFISDKVTNFKGSIFKLGKVLFVSVNFSCTEQNNRQILLTLSNLNVVNDGQIIYLENNVNYTITLDNSDNDLNIRTHNVSFPNIVSLNFIALLN